MESDTNDQSIAVPEEAPAQAESAVPSPASEPAPVPAPTPPTPAPAPAPSLIPPPSPIPEKKSRNKLIIPIIAVLVLIAVLYVALPFVFKTSPGTSSSTTVTTVSTTLATSAPTTVSSISANGTHIGTGCIAETNMLCFGLSYSNSRGALSLTFGQATGKAMNHLRLAYVPLPAPVGVELPGIFNSGNPSPMIGTLASGATTNVTIPVGRIALPTSGTLWAMYQVGSNTTFVYMEVATISIEQ